MPAYQIQPTPNPNSLKFAATGRPFIESGLAAFKTPAEAADDPLGAPLFAIQGVANVLILPPFVTVTKDPATDWNEILPRVQAVLDEHLAR